jgi:hypothetical protein
MKNNEEKRYEAVSHDWNTTTIKSGDQMLRRDGNGGEADTWEPFTVNETYLRLIIEFPDDYRYPDGKPVAR